jgi:hypothetical protein
MNRSGTMRCLAAALLGLGLFAAVTDAQSPRPAAPPADPLDQAAARQKIADQKAETEVLAAIADAERQAKTNPARAVQTLKAAQTNIDLAVSLSGTARKSLIATLESKIAAIQGRPLTTTGGTKSDTSGTSVKNDRDATAESYSAEIKTINDSVQRIAKYKRDGLNKDADYEISKLARMYPNNPSVIRLQERDDFDTRVKDSVAFADLQHKRITKVLTSVDKASLPPGGNGDIEFPPDWIELTDRRKDRPKLTPEEKKIVESLNKPVTVDWNNRPLDEALQDLSDKLGQKLFLDKKSVDDLGIDLRKPVSLQTNGVSAKTVLRQTLASQGLTFVVKDQVIQVVDVEKARNMLSTKVYYLGDLVQGTGPFGEAKWGPFLNMQQTQANVDAIIKSITGSIDPLCWKQNGGPCSITFHFPSMSIIVRASAEVHSSLGSTFGGGK